MQILSEKLKVTEIKTTEFEKVPRATLESPRVGIAIDYHADLCFLKVNDEVEICIYTTKRPEINKNIYLMRGIVYKIGERNFSVSFGGMLMFYKGDMLENIELESEIYLSIAKI